jgi:phosphonate transport system substrate-binding protein
VQSTRRKFIAAIGAATGLAALPALASQPFRLGLTPVFLDNDAEVIDRLRAAFSASLGVDIELEQRRTYEEVTGLLLEGAIDAAWLCGFPYLQHRSALSLLAVPVWNGQPLYQSYLIVGENSSAQSLADLRGATHAFSDPDSNSGYLVTVSDLARMGERAEDFFSRTIFTYGHRNVVRAVADGLVQSGSVDGYVWEAISKTEPALASRTKVLRRSEWLGFPPFCARKDRMNDPGVQAMQQALLDLDQTDQGRAALDLLQLDGMALVGPEIFNGIDARMQDMDALR